MKYFYLLIALYIILTKIVFNADADVQGTFQTSSAAYVVALLSILFILLILIRDYKNIIFIKNNFFMKIPLIYYSSALIFSVLSLLPMLSAFRATTGIGFVLVGGVIGKYLSNQSLYLKVHSFYNLLLVVFISGLAGNYLFSIQYLNNFSIFNLQAGYTALICIYLSMWHFIDYINKKKIKDLLISIFLFTFTALLHSFSAYLSFYIGLVFLFYYTRNYFLSMIFLVFPVVSIPIVISYLNNNLEQVILGKTAGAYLIGSGRFNIYPASFDAFGKFDYFQSIFGIGFMAERNILSGYQLTWSSDPHNSFLVSLLGLGAFGAGLYILFIIAPFFYRRWLQVRIDKYTFIKWIMLHIFFLSYGITSSSYLGVPSMQLILFIIFSFIIFSEKSWAIKHGR